MTVLCMCFLVLWFASVCVLSVIRAERQDMHGSSLATRYWVYGYLEQGVRAGELRDVFEIQNLFERGSAHCEG